MMDQERAELMKALEGFSSAALILENAFTGLSEEDQEILHIDALHSHWDNPDDCVACKVFSKLYGELFPSSFDEWAYTLSRAFVEEVRDRVLHPDLAMRCCDEHMREVKQ